ncbi:MAG TPA: NAD(P)H-dependent oxidoreductase [Pseudonocardiaceae bacterium]
MRTSRLLLISGSTRAQSTNTAVLRTVQEVAPPGMMAVQYSGLADLPAFNPDDDVEPLDVTVAEMRAQIAAADAILFCTPEYAGTLPGSFKNLLDWTVGGGEIYGKPVAWINAAAQGRGLGATASLETVLGYVGTVIIRPACVQIPIARDTVAADGSITDETARTQIAKVCTTLIRHT